MVNKVTTGLGITLVTRFLWLVTVSAAVLSWQAVNAADAAAGKDKSAVCQGCHGVDGNSYSGEWPNLAAQHETYISKQLRNFQTGERKNDIMTAMVTNLSQEDIADIARYFNQQQIQPQPNEFDANLLGTGRKIFKGGNRYSGVPACSGCHGPHGAGISPSAFPSLAGQKVDYVVKQLTDFRVSKRENDPRSIMQNIASRLTDNEIRSVAAYINSLQR